MLSHMFIIQIFITLTWIHIIIINIFFNFSAPPPPQHKKTFTRIFSSPLKNPFFVFLILIRFNTFYVLYKHHCTKKNTFVVINKKSNINMKVVSPNKKKNGKKYITDYRKNRIFQKKKIYIKSEHPAYENRNIVRWMTHVVSSYRDT